MATASEALRAEMDWVIQGLYEPGSIFKPFTCAWGLEHDVIGPETTIPMPPQISWPGIKMIHDSHAIGAGTVVRVIGQSSNTGVAYIAHLLGAARMTELWRRLRLDRPTGIGFKNEAPTRAYKKPVAAEVWPEWLSHRAAYGQGFSMTPLQMACCYCAFARDDARIVKPRIVLNGKRHDPRGPRVCDPKHLATIRRGLESCVLEGTADDAFRHSIYSAAGKTGTSLQRFRPDAKSPIIETNVCTFVGYAPAHDPQVVVLVLAMVPRNTGSGGSVSAPAVTSVMDATLAYWQIESDRGLPASGQPEPRGGPLMAPASHQVIRGARR